MSLGSLAKLAPFVCQIRNTWLKEVVTNANHQPCFAVEDHPDSTTCDHFCRLTRIAGDPAAVVSVIGSAR